MEGVTSRADSGLVVVANQPIISTNPTPLGIRNFIITIILQLSQEEGSSKTLLSKLNITLVQVGMVHIETKMFLLDNPTHVRYSNKNGRITGQTSYLSSFLLQELLKLYARITWSY